MDDLLKYWPIAMFLLNGIMVVAIFALSKTFAKKEDLQELEHRLTVQEQSVKNMPDHDDLSEIREALGDVEKAAAQITGELISLKETMKGVGNQLSMLIQHHLRKE